ncbi:thiamine-phosphate kinase [Methanonatronarchaeum sp. AMET-Sl]|uniref:thiamine-phosphate kinase n=1 Tax=Methanonatronarchaeum sp. AMET-Sl TaxID=3037654 RepID=UPI00244E3DEA|nr:thiamine-phosphate kinase [Methanonatronarchaeum sp. AMET-Sl]WGI17841.1 thiamine-phosphate kinase [Methanonatronarchaeum sp. AMET-Sl]
MRLSNIGERGAIEKITKILDKDSSKIIAGPGEDDCAVIKTNDNDRLLFASDMLTRTRHLPKEISYHNIGWSAVAVNLSDIAAMGGNPLYLTSSIATPDITEKKLKKLIEGMNNCSTQHNSYIVGGDLCQHKEIVIDCSIIGKPPKNTLYRNGASSGEYVGVTGEIGTTGLATKIITKNLTIPKKTREKALKKLFKPKPRIKEGKQISQSGGTAAIDVSDGLLTSTIQLAKSSKIGITLNPKKIPINKKIKKTALKNDITIKELIDIGGDYEILFTTKKPNKIPKNATIIGKTNKEKKVTYGDKPIKPTGYNHFQP